MPGPFRVEARTNCGKGKVWSLTSFLLHSPDLILLLYFHLFCCSKKPLHKETQRKPGFLQFAITDFHPSLRGSQGGKSDSHIASILQFPEANKLVVHICILVLGRQKQGNQQSKVIFSYKSLTFDVSLYYMGLCLRNKTKSQPKKNPTTTHSQYIEYTSYPFFILFNLNKSILEPWLKFPLES